MSGFTRTAALVLALLLAFTVLPLPNSAALAEADGMVRVKLTRLGTPAAITFTTSCDYYINNDQSLKIAAGSTVTVSVTDGKLTIKSGTASMTAASFTIHRKQAGTSGVKFTSPALANVFCGDFKFSVASGAVQVILNIYIEDYLYGVVGYEMSNFYPLDALKAQAIAARNYALRQKAGRTSQAYDLVDTPSDQVFRGYNSTHTNVIKAVDQTRGMTLYYGSSLAKCFYSASNGGQTESTKNAWGSSLAYSIVKDDRYDLESGATSKSIALPKDLSGKTLNANLRNALIAGMADTLRSYGLSTDPNDITIDGIEMIEPVKPKYASPSRLYTYLRFTVNATTLDSMGIKASGKAVVDIPTYDAFETWFGLSINSSANETVWVDEGISTFTVTFRRYGHGIGLSQRGARVMAERYSMNYEDILNFYYPGTTLKTLTLIDKTGDGVGGGNGGSGGWGSPVGQAKIKLSNASSSLNLRAQPSTSSAILTTLKHNTVVNVYSVSGGWTAIGYGAYLGYVMSSYLTSVDSPTPVPTAAPTTAPTSEPTADPTTAPTETPAPTAAPTLAPIGQAKIKLSSSSSTLNLRAKPSTSAGILTRLKHGAIVDVYAVSGDWAAVAYGNYRGYVMKKYLAAVAGTTPTPAPTSTPAPSGDAVYGKVKLSSASSKLNVRAKASTSAKIVTTVKHGAVVKVLSTQGSWARIETSSGAKGYVNLKYLVKVAAPGTSVSTITPDQPIAAAVKEDIFLFRDASMESPALIGLSAGARVNVVSYTSEWAYATYGKYTGYIPLSYLKKVS